MNDVEALRRAVIADPDDDTPRLVYADFLHAQGGRENVLWAEFIRGAVRLEREELWSPAWVKLFNAWSRYQTRVYWQRYELTWTRHLNGRVTDFEFDRGFVGHVTVHPKRFVDDGDTFFAQDPIRSVGFDLPVTKQGTLAKRGTIPLADLFACPHLSRARELRFDGLGLGDSDLELMATSRHLHAAESLSLGGVQRFTARGLVELVRELPAVREFVVRRGSWFDDTFAAAFAASPALAKLASLDLGWHVLTHCGLATLLATEHGAGLRELSAIIGWQENRRRTDEDERPEWRFSPEDGEVVASVLAKCKFPNLRLLNATGWRMGDAGLTALVSGGGFPALRQLDLRGNDLTLKGVEVLADSPLGKQLVYVVIGFVEGGADAKTVRVVRKLFPNANVACYGVP